MTQAEQTTKPTPTLAQVVDDLFYAAHTTAAAIEGCLRHISVNDGGWAPGTWGIRTGGTLTVRDAEGRIVRQEIILTPDVTWANSTAEYAGNKTQAVINDENNRPSIEMIDDEAGVYAGGIPFQYTCPVDGAIKTGSIAFSGWPQIADHVSVTMWASMGCLTFERQVMLDLAGDCAIRDELLELEQGWAM